MDLIDVDLLQLQTSYMKDDPTTQAMCAAIGPQLQQIAGYLSRCLILANVDSLPEEVLDELAYELHIEWYSATASIDVKRSLIKNSDKVHRYLGTPFAVEQVVQDYFGDGIVEEWFEYGGQPYHFRVRTKNKDVPGELITQFTNAVSKVKNLRSVMDGVVLKTLYGDLKMWGMTYGSLKVLTYGQIKTYSPE